MTLQTHILFPINYPISSVQSPSVFVFFSYESCFTLIITVAFSTFSSSIISFFFFQVGWSEYHSLLKIWTYCGLQKYNISSVFQIISYFFSFFFPLLVNVELLFSEIVCRFPHYLFFWVAVAGKYILNVHVQLGLFFFYILALIYQQWNFSVVLLCSHSVLQDDSGILRNQL